MFYCCCSERERSRIHYSQLSLKSWLDFANTLILTIFRRKNKRSLEENQSSEQTQAAHKQIQIRKCFQLKRLLHIKPERQFKQSN